MGDEHTESDFANFEKRLAGLESRVEGMHRQVAEVKRENAAIAKKVNELVRAIGELGDRVETNDTTTNSIKQDTAELLTTWKNLQGTFALVTWVSKALVVLAPIAAAFAAWKANLFGVNPPKVP